MMLLARLCFDLMIANPVYKMYKEIYPNFYVYYKRYIF